MWKDKNKFQSIWKGNKIKKKFYKVSEMYETACRILSWDQNNSRVTSK
jgi:hypothetical protein